MCRGRNNLQALLRYERIHFVRSHLTRAVEVWMWNKSQRARKKETRRQFIKQTNDTRLHFFEISPVHRRFWIMSACHIWLTFKYAWLRRQTEKFKTKQYICWWTSFWFTNSCIQFSKKFVNQNYTQSYLKNLQTKNLLY